MASMEKIGISALIIIIWVLTGGMMTVHFISYLLGETTGLLLVIGMFIPPLGIINALAFLFTGSSLDDHF